MHPIYSLFLLLLLISCQTTVSPHRKSVSIQKKTYQHIQISDFQIHTYTPGDIEFTTGKRKLRSVLRQLPSSVEAKIVLYGKTIIPPHYQLFLLESDTAVSLTTYKEEGTLIQQMDMPNGKVLYFISMAEKGAEKSARKDARTIFSRFTYAP